MVLEFYIPYLYKPSFTVLDNGQDLSQFSVLTNVPVHEILELMGGSRKFRQVGPENVFLTINTGLDKQRFSAKNVNIFLPTSLNICFGCSKEPSHLDGSLEYPQHMFWLRNKIIKFSLHSLN